MQINEKIKSLREAKKWSQEEMAMRLHLSKNGYAKIERGETRLCLQRLRQIADVLDEDVLAFFGGGGVDFLLPHSNESWQNEIVQYQQIIALKDEIVRGKDELIAAQKAQLALLQEKVAQLQQQIALLQAA